MKILLLILISINTLNANAQSAYEQASIIIQKQRLYNRQDYTAKQSNIINAMAYKNTKKMKELIKDNPKKYIDNLIFNAYGYDVSMLGYTALNYNVQATQYLLENNASAYGLDHEEYTPMFFALYNKHYDIAELLLKYGYNPSIQTNEFNKYKSTKPLPLFYSSMRYTYLDKTKPFALMAVKYSPKLIYTKQMKEKPDDFPSYIYLALKHNFSYDVVKYLLDNGEDINKKGKYNKIPYEVFLENASYSTKNNKRDNNVLNLFLDKGLNPYDIKKKKHDIYHEVCYEPLYIVQDDIKLFNRLLKAGLNPNEIRCYRQTTIASAAEIGNIEIFKKLLELKGDVYIGRTDTLMQIMRSKKSQDLLHWVVENRFDLFQNASKEKQKLYLKVFRENVSISKFPKLKKFLLANVVQDKHSLTKALKKATRDDKLELAQELLDSGASFDTKLFSTQHFYNKYANQKTISWLLDKKVNPFGKYPIRNVIRLDKLSYSNLEKLLKIASKKSLNEIFRNIVSLHGSNDGYLKQKRKIDLFKQYGMSINDIKTKDNKNYVDEYILRYFIRRGVNIQSYELFTLVCGYIPSKEVIKHYEELLKKSKYKHKYILNIYKNLQNKNYKLNFKANSKDDEVLLNRFIEDSLRYYTDYKNMAELFTMMKIFPAINIPKNTDKLEYLAYYASVYKVWDKLQYNLEFKLKNKDEKYIKNIYNIIEKNYFEAPHYIKQKKLRYIQKWFENEYPNISFKKGSTRRIGRR